MREEKESGEAAERAKYKTKGGDADGRQIGGMEEGERAEWRKEGRAEEEKEGNVQSEGRGRRQEASDKNRQRHKGKEGEERRRGRRKNETVILMVNVHGNESQFMSV